MAEFGREVRLFVCRNFPERRDRGAAVRAALRADFGYLAADLITLPSVDGDFSMVSAVYLMGAAGLESATR